MQPCNHATMQPCNPNPNPNPNPKVGHAMNLVLEEANERIKMPLRKIINPLFRPRVGRLGGALLWGVHWGGECIGLGGALGWG